MYSFIFTNFQITVTLKAAEIELFYLRCRLQSAAAKSGEEKKLNVTLNVIFDKVKLVDAGIQMLTTNFERKVKDLLKGVPGFIVDDTASTSFS